MQSHMIAHLQFLTSALQLHYLYAGGFFRCFALQVLGHTDSRPVWAGASDRSLNVLWPGHGMT